MTVDEMIEVLEAFKEGKKIQYFMGGLWRDCTEPRWAFDSVKYRVKPEKRVRYVIVYPSANTTREMADRNAGIDRTECVRVEYEEGQFDD